MCLNDFTFRHLYTLLDTFVITFRHLCKVFKTLVLDTFLSEFSLDTFISVFKKF